MEENPIADLVIGFQELVAQVPEVVQPLIVALAGTVPFIEGEGSVLIGVVGGLHPVLAAVAGAIGNLLSVVAVVLLGDRVRAAVGRRRRRTSAPKPPSKGRLRFRRLFDRFGVPGASLLGPVALPTQLTSATLVASGVPRGRVIAWQAVAIVLWTSLVTGIVSGVIAVAT